jgi:hypothetical protein
MRQTGKKGQRVVFQKLSFEARSQNFFVVGRQAFSEYPVPELTCLWILLKNPRSESSFIDLCH